MLSAIEVARKHSISRKRVYQIVAEPPEEAKRALEEKLGIEPYEDPRNDVQGGSI